MKKKRTAYVTIDESICKGCGLCVSVCPTETLSIRESSNTKGYFPAAQHQPDACTGCLKCASMCPEVAIFVFAG